jgi:GDP-D-mannose 3',5'-epimerase
MDRRRREVGRRYDPPSMFAGEVGPHSPGAPASQAGRRTSLVTGAGGFIGGHVVKRLLARGDRVRGVDVKPIAEWHQAFAGADNLCADLAIAAHAEAAVAGVADVYHFASDMGGIGFIGANDIACMTNARLTLALADAASRAGVARVLFASSACVYPAAKQTTAGYRLKESDALPADPPEGYGWEKLYSEKLLTAYGRAGRFAVRLPRLHNIYGPHGAWIGGREKAPAAVCRKVCVARRLGEREVRIWGSGEHSRSFCHVEDCVRGLLALMQSSWSEPINIGSDEAITANGLARLVAELCDWPLEIRNEPAKPAGVAHRNADISLARKELGWEPRISLREGLDALSRDIDARIARLDDVEVTALAA